MRKVLVVLAVALLVSLVVVLAIPILYKDRIVAAVQERLDQELAAKVTFADADVGMLRSFPHLSVGLADLQVAGEGAFEGVDLARVKRLEVVLDLGSFLSGGALEIRRLSLEQPKLNVVIREDGSSNLDLLAKAEGTPAEPSTAAPTPAGTDAPAGDEASAFALRLRGLAIQDLDLIWDDRQGDTRVDLVDLDLEGDGDVSADDLYLSVDATLGSLTVRDGGVTWLRDTRWVVDVGVGVTPSTGRIRLAESSVRINDLPLGFSGTVTPQGDDLDLDLSARALESSFKSVLSLIPAIYAADFAGLTASGTVAFQAKVKGLLPAEGDDLPGLDLALQVKDGHFKYPALPASVDDVQVDLAVRHPGGPMDAMEIDLTRGHLVMAGNPIDATLVLRHPDTDPDVKARVKGTVDLATLQQVVPMEGMSTRGRALLDLEVAGRVSQFEAANVDAVRAAGTFTLEDVVWEDADLPLPVQVDRLACTLDPRAVDLADLRVRFGKSDLSGLGRFDNLLPWALTDAPLVGRMEVKSGLLDLTPFTGSGEAEKPAARAGAPSTGSAVIPVPDNLDLALQGHFTRVLYDDMDLSDVTGAVLVKGGAVRIDKLSAGLLGGRVTLDGGYKAPTDQWADVDVAIDMKDFEVGRTVALFDTLEKIAPVASATTGRFSVAFDLETRLGKDLSPDLASLLSSGSLSTFEVKVQPKFMAEVARKLGNDRFKAFDLKNRKVAFRIRDGRVRIDPVALSVAGVEAKFGGTTGLLDETMDLALTLQVPVGEIKAAELLAKAGAAKGGTVDLQVKVGGTFSDPKVTTNLGDLAGAVLEAVAEQAEQKLDAAAQELLDEASRRGDQLVAEAQKKADQLVAVAKEKGDQLRKEAKEKGKKLVKEAKGSPLKETAAKEASKALQSEADKAADKLEKAAQKEGRALVDAAKKEKEKLVKKAQGGIDADLGAKR